jgi:hypothetical protein
MAPGPRGIGDNLNIKYFSVLGKMFEGRIDSKYFKERVLELYNQFGNRTITIAETESKTDFKALSHAYRVAVEAKELLETSFIKFPLTEAEFIKEIKQGKHNTELVIDLVHEILEEVDVLMLNSKLPKESNIVFIEDYLLSLYD